MMRRILFLMAGIFALAMVSCHEQAVDMDFGPIESGYPSTHFRLNNSILNKLKNEYLISNHPRLYTSIDTFGFITTSIQSEQNLSGNYKFGPISQTKAKSIAKMFLQRNSKFTGIADTLFLKFNIVMGIHRYQRPDFCQWNVIIENQIYKGLEVENSKIYLHLDSLGVYRGGGNWYSEIKIPERDNLSYEMAKAHIAGLKLSTGSWSGPIEHTVGSNADYQEPTVRKLIYPLKFTDRIELHVVWQLYPAIWRVLVDTSTGEIIHSEPTVIF